jgi:hypothetical protein
VKLASDVGCSAPANAERIERRTDASDAACRADRPKRTSSNVWRTFRTRAGMRPCLPDVIVVESDVLQSGKSLDAIRRFLGRNAGAERHAGGRREKRKERE